MYDKVNLSFVLFTKYKLLDIPEQQYNVTVFCWEF